MSKDNFIRIPLPEDERQQIEREAQRHDLDVATWAKRALLRAAARAEAARKPKPPASPDEK